MFHFVWAFTKNLKISARSGYTLQVLVLKTVFPKRRQWLPLVALPPQEKTSF